MSDGVKRDDDATAEVSRACAAAGLHEAPPAHVDRAILEQAARRARRRGGRSLSKLAYVASAAVLLLSFSVILTVSLSTREPTSVASDAAPEAGASPPATAPEADGAARALAVDPAGGPGAVRLQSTDSAAESAPIAPDEAAMRCADDRRATPEAWLACIVDLRSRDASAAARELALFRERFPGRALPSQLTTAPR